MKLSGIAGLSLLIICLVIAFWGVIRPQGEITVNGTANETDRVVNLSLHIRTSDSRALLSKFSIELNVGSDWKVIKIEAPTKGEMRNDVYGPASQWKSVSIDLADSVILKEGKEVQCEISLARQAGKSTNAIDGNVSYLGAAIWEKVDKGQRNAEYFRIPISTTP